MPPLPRYPARYPGRPHPGSLPVTAAHAKPLKTQDSVKILNPLGPRGSGSTPAGDALDRLVSGWIGQRGEALPRGDARFASGRAVECHCSHDPSSGRSDPPHRERSRRPRRACLRLARPRRRAAGQRSRSAGPLRGGAKPGRSREHEARARGTPPHPSRRGLRARALPLHSRSRAGGRQDAGGMTSRIRVCILVTSRTRSPTSLRSRPKDGPRSSLPR